MSDDLSRRDQEWQHYRAYLLKHVRPKHVCPPCVTYADLVAWDACDLREQFQRDFPDGLVGPGLSIAAWLDLLDRGYARGLGFIYAQTLAPAWRIVLCGADLRRYDLTDAELTGADLAHCNLAGVDLRGAHLGGARLYRADLQGADLRGAFLKRTNLLGADLRGAQVSV
jgi:hypothetical protein